MCRLLTLRIRLALTRDGRMCVAPQLPPQVGAGNLRAVPLVFLPLRRGQCRPGRQQSGPRWQWTQHERQRARSGRERAQRATGTVARLADDGWWHAFPGGRAAAQPHASTSADPGDRHVQRRSAPAAPDALRLSVALPCARGRGAAVGDCGGCAGEERGGELVCRAAAPRRPACDSAPVRAERP